MNEHEKELMKVTDVELSKDNENDEMSYETSSSGGASLSTLIGAAAIFGAGIVANKVVGAIKKRKKKETEEPKNKVKKKLMWVEVPEEEPTEVEQPDCDVAEEVEPEVVEKEEKK